MVTTIQLNKNVKNALDRLKSKKETYEETIVKMMDQLEKQRRQKKELIIEGYKKMAEKSIKITKEFEAIEEDFDWKW